MARTRLLLGWSDDPDVVAELACNRLEQSQAACVDAVVIGQEDTHSQLPMRDAQTGRNCGKNAPYSQQVGDLFTVLLSVLVKARRDIYSAALGMTDLPGSKSRKSQS